MSGGVRAPAGCTIAQIIVESGQGDHLSGLATQDHNLFGMKWSSSYALCEEVAGKSSWRTGEEYGGEQVTITADFISFVGDAECIRFRSRVFLQADRYASNALIREAIANHDSDKMAEGLKDAGWATSSSYVESLKSTMETYNLYRFDGMSLEDFRSGAVLADAIVSAAYSQLGVPYVWGGTTPGVGLDCSGLTQYCYKQAGISIPRNTEAQYAQGKKIALSEAAARRHPLPHGACRHLHRGRPLHPRAPSGRGREDRKRDLELHLRPVVSIDKEQEDGQEDETDGHMRRGRRSDPDRGRARALRDRAERTRGRRSRRGAKPEDREGGRVARGLCGHHLGKRGRSVHAHAFPTRRSSSLERPGCR